MRSVLRVAVVTALVLVPASASAGVAGVRPRVALTISPTRVALVAPASRAIELRNVGADPVAVDLARKRMGRRTAAKTWLAIRPARVFLRAGAKVVFTVRVKRPRRAEPGDHHVLVLATTRPQRGRHLAVRMRLGVVVKVRVPGRIVRRLEFRRLRVRRAHRARVLSITLANRGNVTEQLVRVTTSLVRRGQVVARLRSRVQRELLPGGQTVVELRYRGRVRGSVSVIVKVRLRPGVHSIERRYRIRL